MAAALVLQVMQKCAQGGEGELRGAGRLLMDDREGLGTTPRGRIDMTPADREIIALARSGVYTQAANATS